MEPERLVVLGQVVGAHGLRGQIRVRYFGDGPENLLGVPSIRLGESLDDPTARRFEVVSRGTGRAGEARLGLSGIEDRDAARALRGGLVLASEAELEPLPEDEYYWHELIGCRVLELAREDEAGEAEEAEGREVEAGEALQPAGDSTEHAGGAASRQADAAAGREIGRVVEIWETGAHDVLVVEDEAGRRHLIPTAREFMHEVDREARTILVHLIPGLLDEGEGAGGGGGHEATRAGAGARGRPGRRAKDK
jgi:16S rRNA processing protein RimM